MNQHISSILYEIFVTVSLPNGRGKLLAENAQARYMLSSFIISI